MKKKETNKTTQHKKLSKNQLAKIKKISNSKSAKNKFDRWLFYGD